MGFNEDIKELAQRLSEISKSIKTEEATKTSMIMPFFQLLGYNVFNPSEFCPEYIADVGVKKGEKVDYAILSDNIPEILIECKWCGDNLTNHDSQLFRYFSASSAKFAILTNGISYKFFTDLEESNKMDLTPFLEIDMNNLTEATINSLKKFCKELFDKETIFSTASELKYSNLIKQWFKTQTEEVSNDLAKIILANIYDGIKTQKVIDRFKPIIKKSLNGYINDIVTQKISAALDNSSKTEEEATINPDMPVSKIVTTEEELQAFNIVRAILSESVNLDKIYYRDTESYFGILYENNNRKPICRLNLDTKKKQLLIPDSNKKFFRYYIDNIIDIYKYKDNLLESVKRYE